MFFGKVPWDMYCNMDGIFLYLPGYGGGSEATGAFFFLNTYGGFLRWRIWATYSFFSIQHAFIDFECFCAFLCKV